MPLIAHNDLPTFQRLRDEGRIVLSEDRAHTQEIREMHIGLLNMMPDGALQATERQFFRLIGESNRIAQFYVHPFTLPELERSAETQAHIDTYYESYEEIKAQGLDALIITGANVSDPELSNAPFWEPLQEIIEWSWDNVASTLCSCLATHAVMEFKYNQKRQAMKKKLWGVYKHQVSERTHPLVRGVNSIFDVPHSRWNKISDRQFKEAGMRILTTSKKAGVHLATSPDGFRIVCFQGHPEYDTISLYKEYQRDLINFLDGDIKKEPPLPCNYLNKEVEKLIKAQRKSLLKGKEWTLSDEELYNLIDNSWRDTARGIIGNWVGLVYQITNVDRQKQYMDGVDPNNPLKILQQT